MFYRIHKSLALLLLALFCLFGLETQAHALDVTALRLGTHPDKTRVVIELSEMSKFRTFMLADPVRLVIDLPAYNWKAGTPPAAKGVNQIRQGALQPGLSRIVLDLSGPTSISSAFSILRNNGQPDRIVIDLQQTTLTRFLQSKSKTFGTLQTDNPSAQTIATKPPRDEAPPSSTLYIPQAKKPLIVIDAGHGGNDPGALGPRGLREKNITLAMAKDLKKHLEATGRYRVILTRSTDVFIRLSERVAFARRNNADLFISLHADSINRSSVHGASIYTLSERASDAETEKLAARENQADAIAGINLDTQDKDVANILVDLAMRDTMNQSKFFANKIVSLFRSNSIKTLDTAHRFAGFAVLKAPDIPSVLIEMGYMSNDKEASMLSTPAYRNQIANALVAGIDGYFNTINHNK